ncbi:protein-serine/threonineeeee kinase [Sporothrix schenckii 1099-18]|uniref:non-specific serine/threonine protein kinase n=2 Tax=Sporothrix schenckii TaxID=29908 RepID=U7PRW0_SPOS1|nr:protein-serine/threonineeeee kinase [Sporothrix schenckii 1099-18]ERS97210.1 CAMK/CAMKL/PASK protein kinase [Sporothrix schenckii ATCC 58251]KJR86437.1 protein-serine/threonineeeee kinase [Sporothrix schenckii 1099-18]
MSPAPGATAHIDDEAEHDTSTDSPVLRQTRTNSSNQLALPLHIPKNRSTGNLTVASPDVPDHKARLRFSFDAGASAAEYDAATRLVPLPVAASPYEIDVFALAAMTAPLDTYDAADTSVKTLDEWKDAVGACTDSCLCIVPPFVQDRVCRDDVGFDLDLEPESESEPEFDSAYLDSYCCINSVADPASEHSSPIMTDHDHGLGLSGLRRIRQHAPPVRAPTLPADPSNPSSRSTSFGLPRSASMTAMLQHANSFSSASDAVAPAFSEDLSRFPSESLHSFSFASHQSNDMLHSHQSVFKRSIEFMKDRMGYAAGSSNAGLASAQARATGDVETQTMLDLLARAQLVGANNLSSTDQAFPTGPLTGPPDMSGENVFEANFIPRTASPELMAEPPSVAVSEAASSPLAMAKAVPATQPRDSSMHQLRDERPSLSISSVSQDDSNNNRTEAATGPPDSAESSRTPTNESGTTQKTSPPTSRRPSLLLRRTLTDLTPVAVQQRLLDTLATPYVAPPIAGTGGVSPRSLSLSADAQSDTTTAPPLSATAQSFASPMSATANFGERAHGHPTRWVPAAQAIFTTEAKPPYTIIAANDLACLVFGVTKAEVRKMGILEVVQQERRAWLEKKLQHVEGADDDNGGGGENTATAHTTQRSSSIGDIAQPVPKKAAVNTSSLLGARGGGITAKLLSKPNSRSQTPQNGNGARHVTSPQQMARRASTINTRSPKAGSVSGHHNNNQSRGVLLCGDVVPIQKRNGATGSASLWVKEKRVGLIWVLEEIHEDVATVAVDEDGFVSSISGATGPIWGDDDLPAGTDISKLIPRIARQGIDGVTGSVDFAELTRRKFYTCRNGNRVCIPTTVEQIRGQAALRVSSFPHIAGIVVVSTQTLTIKSSNSVFCGALFGYEKPNGLSINQLVPEFDKILQILVEVDNVHMVDGIVVPEHSFRRAAAFLALREGRPDAASAFLRPDGLPGRHRDGSEFKIDVQMRVVKSETQSKIHEETVIEADEEDEAASTSSVLSDSVSPPPSAPKSEMVYALWITYSRHLHAASTRNSLGGIASPLLSGAATPLHQPSPGQTPVHSPFEAPEIPSDDQLDLRAEKTTIAQSLTRQLKEAALSTASRISSSLSRPASVAPSPAPAAPPTTADAHLRSASPASLPPVTSAKTAAATPSLVTPAVTITTATPSSTTPDLAVLAKAGPTQPPASPGKANVTVTTTAVAPSPSPNSTNTVVPQKPDNVPATVSKVTAAVGSHKKTIDDFVILEDMGQGAYGQVKLAKEKATGRRVVIKYVTKKRILVDTWTRDRRLGTVPLEIHVLDYLRRDGLRHPNIVEMEDFFEDDVNYYIEMKPHGMPGMDLFDYIELRTTMDEAECRSIFVQVAQAIHHLHTKAMVVHRDIKDENVILDGEGNIKLIDFGSAAYIKSGPFDVFVGTIDYAAPEVLAGDRYGGKEQDVWALGILLYTIIYKENPFYSIDEIMDRDLRIPYTISDDSIDLIRKMLNRNVSQRITIDEVLEHPWCQAQMQA